jgi:hypothetical protein
MLGFGNNQPSSEDDDIIDISQQEENTPSQELPDEIEVDTDNPSGGEEPQEPSNPEPEPNEPDSSLTSDPQEGQPETPQPQPELETEPTVVNDESIFSTLSEKLGREIKSYEDLAQAEVQQAEDPFEKDPQLKELKEWKERTGRPLEDWIKYQKDYDSMSNADVVREYLQHKYPDFTPEDIQLEMSNYLADEDDLDSDARKKELNLKKTAIEAKAELGKLKSKFETPAEGYKPSLSTEDQQAIDFYKQYKESQEKATTEAQKQREQYINSVTESVKGVEQLQLKLGEEQTISLKLSPEDTQALVKSITESPRWYNQDGSINYRNMAEDAAKMANFDKAVELAFKQGEAKGLESQDVTDRNIHFGEPRNPMSSPSADDIQVEGADAFTGGPKLKFGFKK